jgi:hypothetical protein
MSIEIHWSPTFLCDGLLNPVRFDHTAVVKHGDKSFLKVIKADRKIERLLLGASDEKKVKNMPRPLSHTNIIEILLQLREAKYKELLAELEKDAAPQKSTGLNEEADSSVSRKTSQTILDQLPKFAAIDAPPLGEANGRKMQVVLENNAPLFVELTKSNFEYLQKAVAHQIEDGKTKRKHTRSDDKGGLAVGVSRIKTGRYTGALRVVKKIPGKEQATTTCIIKAESVARANELASDFIDNHGSKRRRRGVNPVEENEVENEVKEGESGDAEHDAQSSAVEEEEDA